MTAALAHRGPDGRGFFFDRGVALGHRRLSIIDLAGGDQPIYNEDRSVAIVFNGEIYNYKELRSELLSRGHRFATHSDTEVIVHLYEEMGPECVQPLNGMFAFAIWDRRARRLMAARDRLGEKPFYYTQQQGRFLFASELKSLRTAPGVSASVSLPALDKFMTYGYIPAPDTIFEGVHKLPAAHRLVWEKGRVRTERYWKVNFENGRRLTEEDYVAELRRRLEESVRLRLRSDVPLGAFLSGGIDSSAIVALASLHCGRRLQTFSVGFTASDFDESPYARLVAEQYHTDHHEIVVSDLDFGIFPDLVAHFDEPFGDPSALPTYYITREARRVVTVCLSGDGGDEVFAGYGQYAACRQERWVDWLPSDLRQRLFGCLSAVWPDCAYGKGWLARSAASGAVRYIHHVGVFNQQERARLFQPELVRYAADDGTGLEEFFSDARRHPVLARQHADQMTYLPEDVLVKVDRMSMKHALEVRVPLLDPRVVEWANAMPPEMKVRGNIQKYIFKKMLADLLPEEILSRPKHGFGVPIKHWFRDNLDGFARDLLLSPSSRCHRFFRPERIQQVLDNHGRRCRDLSVKVWTLLWFEQWCRTFKV
jgi:asparagine synthase (glutamine-hydrolysing)